MPRGTLVFTVILYSIFICLGQRAIANQCLFDLGGFTLCHRILAFNKMRANSHRMVSAVPIPLPVELIAIMLFVEVWSGGTHRKTMWIISA